LEDTGVLASSYGEGPHSRFGCQFIFENNSSQAYLDAHICDELQYLRIIRLNPWLKELMNTGKLTGRLGLIDNEVQLWYC
jgi:hypothetical protein